MNDHRWFGLIALSLTFAVLLLAGGVSAQVEATATPTPTYTPTPTETPTITPTPTPGVVVYGTLPASGGGYTVTRAADYGQIALFALEGVQTVLMFVLVVLVVFRVRGR